MEFAPAAAVHAARAYAAKQREIAAEQDAAIQANMVRISPDYPRRAPDGSMLYVASLYLASRALHTTHCNAQGITADGQNAAKALTAAAATVRDKALAIVAEQDAKAAAIEAGTYVEPKPKQVRKRALTATAPARRSSWDRVASGRSR